MFWIFVLVSIVSVIFIRVIIVNKLVADKNELSVNSSTIEETVGGEVIVVDKMIIFTQTKKNKYVIFIQLKTRKILEVNVSKEVFESVKAGDYGEVGKLNEGIYGFEKVS